MEYHSIEPISRSEAEAIFASGNEKQITLTLIRLAYHDGDWKWVQSKCLHYIESEDEALQDTAILCLGHLARIHRQLDLDIVLPLLKDLKNNPNLQGRVEDAMDDIEMFITKKSS